MNRGLRLLLAVTVIACAAHFAHAADVAGTAASDIAALNLPAPSSVKVAVLPLYDLKGIVRHGRLVSAEMALVLMRCGFNFVPNLETRDPKGIGTMLAATQAALAADAQVVAGEPLRLDDAVRIGKSLGADWVVYGEVIDLHVYDKQTFWTTVKKGTANIKVNIADVAAGKLILTRQCKDQASGGVGMFRSRATSIERGLSLGCVTAIYRSLCQALPAHKHEPEGEVGDDQVSAAVDAWAKIAPEGGKK